MGFLLFHTVLHYFRDDKVTGKLFKGICLHYAWKESPYSSVDINSVLDFVAGPSSFQTPALK